MVKKIRNGLGNLYLVLILLMLYLPIGILIVSSFNASPRNKAALRWSVCAENGVRRSWA